MKLPRRNFLHLAAGAAALPAVSRVTWAQAYPTRPVRIIAPFPAGQATDSIARLMGQSLSERLGQQFVIENRTGAGGNIGTESVVRALPDGYTLLLVGLSNAVNATLYKKLNYDFIRDIAPVASIGGGPYVMVVNPSVPAKTVPEFVAYAKANSGKINMGSSGHGSVSHVFGELFKMMTGINLAHIPYRGGLPSRSAQWTGAGRVRHYSHEHSVHQVRHAARAGCNNGNALGCAAGHPDCGRIRAGLRGECVVRRRRAKEYARRGNRQAQQTDRRLRGRSYDKGAACRPRR
jgi:tripartite-type tricarboxylate transporter receptor subunit TctC